MALTLVQVSHIFFLNNFLSFYLKDLQNLFLRFTDSNFLVWEDLNMLWSMIIKVNQSMKMRLEKSWAKEVQTLMGVEFRLVNQVLTEQQHRCLDNKKTLKWQFKVIQTWVTKWAKIRSELLKLNKTTLDQVIKEWHQTMKTWMVIDHQN